MEETILQSIKNDLGIATDYDAFDSTVKADINSAFVTLYELGIGNDTPYRIETGEETWGDISDREEIIRMLRPYIYMRVRLMFDPPSSSYLLESLSKQIAEFEWRLNVLVETPSLGGISPIEEE